MIHLMNKISVQVKDRAEWMVEADGFGNKPLWLANSPEEVLHLKLEEDDRMMGEEPSVN